MITWKQVASLAILAMFLGFVLYTKSFEAAIVGMLVQSVAPSIFPKGGAS